MASRFLEVALTQLARRGFVVRRHPGVRRQAMLAMHGVDLVLDVGAASGAYGRELRDFGYAGDIVSFEPLTRPYQRLREASAGDARWSSLQTALGSETGRATINVASNSDSSSLLPMADAHRTAAPQVDYVDTEEIDVARLDDVVADRLTSSTRPFLKLDTQGFEKEVLAGGPRTLSQSVGIQVELSFVELYDGGMLVDEAISLLYGEGFRMVGIDQGMTSPQGQLLQADGVFFRPGSLISR